MLYKVFLIILNKENLFFSLFNYRTRDKFFVAKFVTSKYWKLCEFRFVLKSLIFAAEHNELPFG